MSEFYLAATLFTSDGSAYRFGPDEASAEDMPKDIQWDTQIPGGFHTASIVLPRPPDLRADEAHLFSDVEVYGPGGRVFYKGRVTGVPQVGPAEIRLELEGPIAALDDNEFFREIYIDRDLTKWGGPSTQRRLDLLALGIVVLGSGEVGFQQAGSAGPGFTFAFLDFSAGIEERMETWYYGGGADIGKLRYSFDTDPGSTDPDWTDRGFLASNDNDVQDDWDSNVDHDQTDAANQIITATEAGRKYAGFASSFGGSFTGTSNNVHMWLYPAVIGRHGLTERGTWPTIGFYSSDIIEHAVENGSSLDIEHIEATTAVITHAAYADPGTPRRIVEHMTALGSENTANEPNDWGAYESGLFWRPPGSYGTTWRLRRDQFAESTSAGPAASERCAKVVITYEDGLGNKKSVGPVGSDADFETALLEDTDPSNPAIATGKTKVRDIGISYQDGAVLAGRLLLAESNALTQRGSVTVKGEVMDDAGNRHPACAVRAGDRVVFEDDDEPEELPINSTSYSHDSLTLTANVGAAPHSLDTLLAQLSEATALLR